MEELIQIIKNDGNIYFPARDEIDDGQDLENDRICDSIKYISDEYNLSPEEAIKVYSEVTSINEELIKDLCNTTEINLDEQISEVLKLAGVKLD